MLRSELFHFSGKKENVYAFRQIMFNGANCILRQLSMLYNK